MASAAMLTAVCKLHNHRFQEQYDLHLSNIQIELTKALLSCLKGMCAIVVLNPNVDHNSHYFK